MNSERWLKSDNKYSATTTLDVKNAFSSANWEDGKDVSTYLMQLIKDLRLKKMFFPWEALVPYPCYFNIAGNKYFKLKGVYIDE